VIDMSAEITLMDKLERENKAIQNRLGDIEMMVSGKKVIPKIHILDAKLGRYSISVTGSTITMGDGAADPDATGELQRNSDELLYHDGTDALDLTVGRVAFTAGRLQTSLSDTRYMAIGGETLDGTEADVHIPIPYAMTVRRLVGMCGVNTTSALVTLAFRDDAANAASATVASGVVTSFDSGAQAISVAAGSHCNFMCDLSATDVGVWGLESIIAIVDISMNV